MAELPSLLIVLGQLGTLVFAISGAIQGLRHRLDVIGIGFVAAVTGVGGGTLRDVLLGNTPVGWVTNPVDLLICLSGAVLVITFNARIAGRRLRWLAYSDALGLAVFSVTGTHIALNMGAHPFVAVLFGAMSASFGGVIRDVVCGDVPLIFREDLYILPALLGAAAFIALDPYFSTEISAVVASLVALSVRVAAIILKLSLPVPHRGENI